MGSTTSWATTARESLPTTLREALAILGAAKPGKPLRPREWAELAVRQSLAKTLFSPAERETEKGRERGIGGVMKKHIDVTFEAASEAKRYRLQLEGGLRRWVSGKNPHNRYVFTVLDEADIPVEE